MALAVVVAALWSCLDSPNLWHHTRLRSVGGTVWVKCGAEGQMRPAIFDDPANVRVILVHNAAFDNSKSSLLKGYVNLWRLILSHEIQFGRYQGLRLPLSVRSETSGHDVGDEGVRLLLRKGVRGFVHLDLGLTHVSDGGVRCLCDLPDLQDVYLDGTGVSDRGLRELGKKGRLETSACS